MKNKKFDKYEKQGAYHFKEYETGTRGYKEHVNYVVSLFSKEEGTSFLDIGCGEGLITRKVYETKKFKGILGIDNNLRAIELAIMKNKEQIESGGLTFAHKAFSGLNQNVRYQCILVGDVIEHVPNPEGLLSVVNRLMSKYAIITTPNRKYNKPDKYDYNSWDKKEFERLLKPYNYEFLRKGRVLCVKLKKSN